MKPALITRRPAVHCMTYVGFLLAFALTTVQSHGTLFARYRFESNFVNSVDNLAANTSGLSDLGFTQGPPEIGQGLAVSFIDDQGHEVWRNIAAQGVSFSNLTVAFWVKTTQANWRVPLTLEAQTAQNHRMALQISLAGHIYLANPDGLPGATGIWTDPNPAAYVADGEWHHVTWTADEGANSSILYVNGVQVGANTWGATAGVRLWMLGKLKESVVNNYTGDIDDFRIYSNAVTSDQVQFIMPAFGLWGLLAIAATIAYAARRRWRALPLAPGQAA